MPFQRFDSSVNKAAFHKTGTCHVLSASLRRMWFKIFRYWRSMDNRYQAMMSFCCLASLILFVIHRTERQQTSSCFQSAPSSPFVWTCDAVSQRCNRVPASIVSRNESMSHATCKLTCYDSSVIWPIPTSPPKISRKVVPFKADQIKFSKLIAPTSKVEGMLREAGDIFLNLVRSMESNGNLNEATSGMDMCSITTNRLDLLPQEFYIEITVKSNDIQLTTKTNESYTLIIKTESSKTTCYIVAPTFFGARHALETLSQLIAWDDLINSLVVVQDGNINDKPVFPHRGLLIDSSRSYTEIPLLKRIIDGLSYNKMNVLHWHLTDSHSFPFVSLREPLMSVYGAYTPRSVYRPEDIRELVHYGLVRGVKIIPELDGPAHTGAGWEWGRDEGLGDLTLCYGKEPYHEYCAEPPCGILNPINDNVYRVLNNLYKDMSELFQSDVFHLGGDEVNFKCWEETEGIAEFMKTRGWDESKSGFLSLWSYYQNRSLEELDKAYGKQQDVIFWTSDLTVGGHAPLYLDPKRYIVQFWNGGNDLSTKALLEQKYRVIMSNSDALYLDCGYSSWIGTSASNNWCSPYKGWQVIYENSPRRIVENFDLNYGDHVDQFIGGEAAMWTEQVEGWAMESKLWPRTSALAERLWSDPTTDWKLAESRMRTQRNRMVGRGIAADSIQPQYCDQHDGSC